MSAALKLLPSDDLVAHVKHAIHETFRQVYGVSPTFGEPVHKSELDVSGDISGAIALVQDHMNGNLILTFDKPAILAIATKIYRKEMTEINKSVASCVSELCNMSYGVMKKHMNPRGYKFKMSLPTIVQGDAHIVRAGDIAEIVEIPTTLGDVTFKVTIVLSKEGN